SFMYASAGSAGKRVNVIYRDGATENITVNAPGPRRGVWVPAALATQLEVKPGGLLRLGFIGGPQASLPVAGVYQDLWQAPTTPFWCSYGYLFQNPGSVDPPPPALLIATDAQTFAGVQHATGLAATHHWVAAIETSHLTLSGARELIGRQDAAYAAAGERAPQDFGAQNSGPGQLPAFAGQTSLIRDGLRGPVVPIALGGTVLALLLVGAAGSYWTD